MIDHPFIQQTENDREKEYYKKRDNFLKKNGLTNTKSFSFLTINENAIQQNIYKANNIVFEVTERCNLDCVYCINGDLYGERKKQASEQVDMPKEDAFKLLEYLSPFWHERKQNGIKQTIRIGFYGGEPLLNISLIQEIVEWTKLERNNGFEFSFYLTTNGIIIDKYIDFFIKNDFDLNVSLDGNKDNNAYRTDHNGNNSFDKVYKNIKSIQREHPDYFSTNIDFLTVSHNKNPLDQVSNFLLAEFNKLPSPSNLNVTGINPEKKGFFDEVNTIPEVAISHDVNKKIIDKGGSFINSSLNFIHHFSGYVFFNYNDLLQGSSDTTLTRPSAACTPFSMKIFMNARGKIFPCERIDNSFAMGDIHDNIIFDIEKIAAKYNSWYEKLIPLCSVCQRKFSCNKCLFHISDINDKPHCDKMMNQELFGKHFNTIIRFLKDNNTTYRKVMKEITAAI